MHSCNSIPSHKIKVLNETGPCSSSSCGVNTIPWSLTLFSTILSYDDKGVLWVHLFVAEQASTDPLSRVATLRCLSNGKYAAMSKLHVLYWNRSLHFPQTAQHQCYNHSPLQSFGCNMTPDRPKIYRHLKQTLKKLSNQCQSTLTIVEIYAMEVH